MRQTGLKNIWLLLVTGFESRFLLQLNVDSSENMGYYRSCVKREIAVAYWPCQESWYAETWNCWLSEMKPKTAKSKLIQQIAAIINTWLDSAKFGEYFQNNGSNFTNTSHIWHLSNQKSHSNPPPPPHTHTHTHTHTQREIILRPPFPSVFLSPSVGEVWIFSGTTHYEFGGERVEFSEYCFNILFIVSVWQMEPSKHWEEPWKSTQRQQDLLLPATHLRRSLVGYFHYISLPVNSIEYHPCRNMESCIYKKMVDVNKLWEVRKYSFTTGSPSLYNFGQWTIIRLHVKFNL